VVLPDRPRIALLGDSVLGGLGVRGESYGQLVGDKLDAAQVLGLARSGFTVRTAVGRLHKLQTFGPDLVIVGVGGSEGLVHAPASVQRLLARWGPAGWGGVDGLEPDLWLERGWRARARLFTMQTIKHVSVWLSGGYRRLAADDFVNDLSALLDGLGALGCLIVVVGVQQPDGRLWPRSPASCARYERLTYEVAGRYEGVIVVESKSVLRRWSDYTHDHAHLSASGHRKLADEVLRQLDAWVDN
jgi:hypothetical protein